MNVKENKGLLISIIGIILTISIYGIFFGIPLIIIGIYLLNKKNHEKDLEINQEELNNSADFLECNNNQLKNLKEEEKRIKEKILPQDELTMKKCPYCQDGLIKVYKNILGRETYLCDACGLKYEKKKSNYKLLNINDSRIKNKYLKETLTKGEWLKIFKGGDADLVTFYNWVSEGSIPLTIVSNPPIICKKGETVYLTLENISLKEPRSVRTSVGLYTRPKRNSWNIGGTLSTSESHEELRIIDNGTFIVSNKRLVFMGSKRNVNVNLNKIISINEYKDGISIQRENKQKLEYFTNTNKNIKNFTVDGRSHSIPFYGSIVKSIIQSQIKLL